jgi:peroxiredoxin
VLQRQREVAELYQTNATPTGYLIDAQGNIASPMTAGAEGLLSLAQSRNTDVAATSRNGRGKQDKGLDASKINRNGLKAGAKAPAFNLRRLDGGQLALKELRGRRVLLVFSDPQCGPCEGLALRLEEIHRRSDSVQILMISRGDPELNRRKVAQSSLSFAVVLQKEWEISQLYGMFATPIGYLIDEQGILLSDVAVGAEPILNLLSTHSGSSSAAGN